MHLQREIAEQPEVIARLLAQNAAAVQHVAAAVRAFAPTFVCVAARGTSDNAARYLQYLLGYTARLPVMLATPSLHTLYETPPHLGRALVVGISQSGAAADVARVLADANAQGALTLAITNFDDSLMATTARHHLPLWAGEEQSVAATKTYTAQLAVVAQLAAALTPSTAVDEALARLPDALHTALALAEGVAAWAGEYAAAEKLAVVGRGFNYCTAFEIGLKVKELAYIASESYSEADFRHGPIAVIGANYPVLLVAPTGATLPTMRDLATLVRGRGADVLCISDDANMLAGAHRVMPVPPVPEWLSPVVAVVPGQVFAMHQAVARGHAVDRPRGLTKVTVTL